VSAVSVTVSAESVAVALEVVGRYIDEHGRGFRLAKDEWAALDELLAAATDASVPPALGGAPRSWPAVKS